MKVNLFKSKIEYLIFIVLWLYIIIRAITVFYVHDELATKYSYMMNWNYLPYEGMLDANNHFLNSLLGGFFIRLFHADSMWITRLGNVLAFPILFWSLVKFKRVFVAKFSYLFLLISITSCVFILDFYSLARGYGLAWAFTALAISQSTLYLNEKKINHLIGAALAWLLAVYANLSVLILATLGFVYLIAFTINHKKWNDLFVLVISTLPIIYFANYAMSLKGSGKLYLGDSESFIKTTIHSLSEMLYGSSNFFIDVLIIALFLAILVFTIRTIYKHKTIFKEELIWPLFLLFSIISIYTQNIVLGVNFPEDRAAGFLILLFYGSLAFLLNLKVNSILPKSLIVFVVILFLSQANFSHTRTYAYEHFNVKLLELIPEKVHGIPTSTGGRFWQMDNELSKIHDYPMRVFQEVNNREDTLQDYIIQLAHERPFIEEKYELIFQDKISKLNLYKRKRFLNRVLSYRDTLAIQGNSLYFDILPKQEPKVCFVRCKGILYDVSVFDDFTILLVAENTETGVKYSYGGLNPITCKPISDQGDIAFDFTYTFNFFKNANQMNAYVYNPSQLNLNGSLEVEVYEIDFD